MSESVIGKKYGEWTIVDDAPDRIDATGKHHKRYLCECSCGNQCVKDFYKLKRCDGVMHRLGNYVDKTDAVIARLKAEKEYFGEYAPQRHLFKEYHI